MKKYSLLILLSAAAASCRTASSDAGLRDVAAASAGAAGGKLDCAFVTPDGSGDKVEISAVLSGSNLLGVKSRFTTGRTKQAPEVTLASVPAVNGAVLRKDGKQGIRTYFKDFSDVDFGQFSCFAVDGAKDPGKIGYLCLPGPQVRRERDKALWVTNYGSVKYLNELTVYAAACAPN